MATLTVNDVKFSDKAIVAIYIDSDGKIIASTTLPLDMPVNISGNHIGATPAPRDAEAYLECDITVAAVGIGPSVQLRTLSVMKICYTKTGIPYPC